MSNFDISDKVVIITGGANGLGFEFGVQLLNKGAKAITLVDVNAEMGTKAIEKIESKFGKNKSLFIKGDISKYDEFENAFKQTVDKFENVDILINNAGIFDDFNWKREIEVNLHGTVNGMILGMDHYISKYKSGEEGIIINISSTAGLNGSMPIPIYSGTKSAIIGLTLSWSNPLHYQRTKIRVIAICPGTTLTDIVKNMENRMLSPVYSHLFKNNFKVLAAQTPEQVAVYIPSIIAKAPNGTIWIIEGGEPPFQYKIPHRFSIQKHTLE